MKPYVSLWRKQAKKATMGHFLQNKKDDLMAQTKNPEGKANSHRKPFSESRTEPSSRSGHTCPAGFHNWHLPVTTYVSSVSLLMNPSVYFGSAMLLLPFYVGCRWDGEKTCFFSSQVFSLRRIVLRDLY